MNPVTKWTTSAGLVAGLLLTLTACGGSTSSTDPTPAPAGATGATAGATGSTTAAATPSADPKATDSAEAAQAGSIPDQLCVFLDHEHQMAADASSSAQARARVSSDFKAWQANDKDLAFSQTSELDAITTSHCPKVRQRILDALKSTDLATALG